MTFILISGDPDTGKTHVCQELRDILDQDPSFAKPATPKQVQVKEVLRHYEKKGKHIVLNSAADDDRCMERLARYIDRLGARPDIIITTIRETDVQHDQMSRMLALLDAYASSMTNLAAHYVSGIKTKPIHTPFAPDALSTHAFVLHLERQPLSGTEEEQEQALTAYWDDNAETAKQMLDLAIARLEA